MNFYHKKQAKSCSHFYQTLTENPCVWEGCLLN